MHGGQICQIYLKVLRYPKSVEVSSQQNRCFSRKYSLCSGGGVFFKKLIYHCFGTKIKGVWMPECPGFLGFRGFRGFRGSGVPGMGANVPYLKVLRYPKSVEVSYLFKIKNSKSSISSLIRSLERFWCVFWALGFFIFFILKNLIFWSKFSQGV